MFSLPKFRTARHCLDMHEPSAGDTIAMLDSAQDGATEEAITAGLRACGLGDTLSWTVHERALAVAQYLSNSNPDDPDFQIGDSARYSDYIAVDADYPKNDAISLGIIGGDNWTLTPLLGRHAESIERAIFVGELPASRGGWILGAMACQLFVDNDPDQGKALSDQDIIDRATILKGLPQSVFSQLMVTFLADLPKLDHFFTLDFTAEGIAFSPKKEALVNYPARFPFTAGFDPILQAVFSTSPRVSHSTGDDLQSESD